MNGHVWRLSHPSTVLKRLGCRSWLYATMTPVESGIVVEDEAGRCWFVVLQ